MHKGLSILVTVLLLAPLTALANTVDNFTTANGPITVTPGEEIDEDNVAIDFSNGPLRFRGLGAGMDEDTPDGSSITTQIGGGEFRCNTEYAGGSADEDAGALCVVGWFPAEDQVLDLTATGSFEFGILETQPGLQYGVFLVDTEGDTSFFQLDDPGTGNFTLPIDEFLTIGFPGEFDLDSVCAIALSPVYIFPVEGLTRIGPVSTTGSITSRAAGDSPCPEGEDAIDVEDAFGTYGADGRPGDGCQVTVEGEAQFVVISCYVYLGGEQVWLIGSGAFEDGAVAFENVEIFSGADFGDDFDPNDAVATPWGSIFMSWSDCDNATLDFQPGFDAILLGFTPFSNEFTRLGFGNCGASGPSPSIAQFQGAVGDPARVGEGFHLVALGADLFAVAWYTYLNGEQVFLTGSAVLQGNTLTSNDLILTSGPGWGGPDYPEGIVNREDWGSIVFTFSDCNNATFTATPLPAQTEYQTFQGTVGKVVPGTCP